VISKEDMQYSKCKQVQGDEEVEVEHPVQTFGEAAAGVETGDKI